MPALTGGSFGEGHRDDAIQQRMAAGERRDDASDERGGLPGAGRRLDQEIHIEGLLDDLSLVGIREHG
jgi:hypothetical protein